MCVYCLPIGIRFGFVGIASALFPSAHGRMHGWMFICIPFGMRFVKDVGGTLQAE